MLVYARNPEGRFLKVTYQRAGATALWKQDTDAAGRRTADWYGYRTTELKKQRPKVLIVLDALLQQWLEEHKTDLEDVRIAKLRYRAWNQAQSANYYMTEALKNVRLANEVEQGAIDQTNIDIAVEREAV